MNAFLGWFLGKSMYETRGIGFAWGLHVLLDIVATSYSIDSTRFVAGVVAVVLLLAWMLGYVYRRGLRCLLYRYARDSGR